jgi:quinol monooxygenase YgiN
MSEPDGSPIRAVLTMTVPSSRTADFEREWHRLAAWVAEQPGCLRQTLSRDEGDDPRSYMITSDWADRSTYERFERSPDQDDATASLRRLRTAIAMRVLTIVEHKENL